MRNFHLSSPPHLLPVILDATSELATMPRENVLLWTKPGKPWRTGVTAADQILTLDLLAAPAKLSILLGFVNYPKIVIEKSTNNVWSGATYDIATPNIVPFSDDLTQWTIVTGTFSSRTANYAAGPLSVDRLATRCVWSSANAELASTAVGTNVIVQSVVNRDFVGSFWARTTAGNTVTVQATLRFGVVADSFQSFTVTREWQRFVLARNAGGTATGTDPRLVIRATGSTDDVLIMGAQVTPDTLTHVCADYLTTRIATDSAVNSGNIPTITVRKHQRAGRRKILLCFENSLSAYRYLRLRIPKNLTTDDAELYSTGVVVPSTTGAEFPGKIQFPMSIAYRHAAARAAFDDDGVEMLRLGGTGAKTILTLGGAHLSREVAAAFDALVAPGIVDPYIVHPGMRAPGGGPDGVDESDVILAYRTGDYQEQYEMPEIQVTSLVFEEVI